METTALLHEQSLSINQREVNLNLRNAITSLKEKYTLNKRVLFVQTPQFLFKSFNVDVAQNRGYYAYPPVGLQWIAKALSGRGLQIKILDLNFLVLENIIRDKNFDYHNWIGLLDECLEEFNPSVVGVTSINVNSNVYEEGYPLTHILKHLMKKKQYIVLAGGAISTDERVGFLEEDYCHFVIGNEGENKINFLFDHLYNGGSSFETVGRIFFLNEDHAIEQSKGRPDTVELKGNLIDTFDLIPTAKYHSVGSLNPYSRMVGQDIRYSTLQLFRGCTAKCDFCDVNNFMGNGIRHFPVQDVLEEVTHLVEHYGIRHFDVIDDAFLANRHIVAELLKGMLKLREKYGITWSSNNGLIATQLSDKLMELMRDSGCVGFRIGVESGNTIMLKRMRKPATLSKLKKASLLMNRYPEMFTGANYIIGLFGEETFSEMMETFQFSRKLNLDWASWATFQYTSSRTPGAEQITLGERKGGGDFVPSKGDQERKISDNPDVVSGIKVFELEPDQVPSSEQLKQIWFTFNLVGNYIDNKNLRRGGLVEKFTFWVEAVKIAYPQNPYMSLFSALGRISMGDKVIAANHINHTKNMLNESEYWVNCFSQFGLNDFVEKIPETDSEVHERLETLKESIQIIWD